jgi:phosphoribosylamine--glycine ligase
MRFLGIGEWNSLGDMYLRLAAKGHEVKVFIGEPEGHDVLGGMVHRVGDWQSELGWVREAGKDGIILFESADRGALQDTLREEGFQVIGGSAYGDRLESDRMFGQQALRQIGLRTAGTHAFRDFASAAEFVRARPRRYVYKNNGCLAPSTENYVGEAEDGADILSLLDFHRSRWKTPEPPDFVLMDHLSGIEVGVGAYFDGERFLKPALLDWEHKRFFPGDLGELTGEMGTVVTYRGAERIFDLTLAKLAESLRRARHCGYLNLNTIVNAEGIWPLEFTSRFGYPGFAICDALHPEGWDGVFRRMTGRGDGSLPTSDGFAVGVVVTVPPFPHADGYARMSKGMPVFFHPGLTAEDRENLHFGEVALSEGRLVTSGSLGYTLVATGAGPSVEAARERAYARARKVFVPNKRYRNDIGDRLIREDLDRLRQLGYYPRRADRPDPPL